RWMEYLSCFDFDIRYVKGKLNKVADALSCYYQFDSWDDAPLVQHYVFTDIKERETAAALMTVNAKERNPLSSRNKSKNDPLIHNSQAKGPDLHIHMSELDPLCDDIQKGYANNKFFKKLFENPEDHPGFQIWDRFIWMKNCSGEDVLCVPSTLFKGTTLHGHIIEQAHTVVGHFGPLKTSEYIRCWYWW
ncbi:hypothetical protein L208DRAFT_1213865, partial [Tricholoma matsutake]